MQKISSFSLDLEIDNRLITTSHTYQKETDYVFEGTCTLKVKNSKQNIIVFDVRFVDRLNGDIIHFKEGSKH